MEHSTLYTTFSVCTGRAGTTDKRDPKQVAAKICTKRNELHADFISFIRKNSVIGRFYDKLTQLKVCRLPVLMRVVRTVYFVSDSFSIVLNFK